MGQSIRGITSTADRVANIARIDVSQNVLLAATLMPITAGLSPADTWAEIELVDRSTGLTIVLAQLTQGYIGDHAGISWTGRLPTDKTMEIEGHINSNVVASFRLITITER